MDRFHQHEVDFVPVVDPAQKRKLVGIIALKHLHQARIEIELVLQNPDTAQTLKLPVELLDNLRAEADRMES